MKKLNLLAQLLLVAALCTSMALPAAAKGAKAKKSAPVEQSSDSLQAGLDKFARETVVSLNTHVVPSKQKRHISRNSDGTFTSRYQEIDLNSIKTSYKKPDSSNAIDYIGILEYQEVMYECKGKDRKAAAAPTATCTETSRTLMRELVKNVKGEWRY